MPLESCEDMGFDVNKDVSCIRKIVPELIVYQLFYEIYIIIIINIPLSEYVSLYLLLNVCEYCLCPFECRICVAVILSMCLGGVLSFGARVDMKNLHHTSI